MVTPTSVIITPNVGAVTGGTALARRGKIIPPTGEIPLSHIPLPRISVPRGEVVSMGGGVSTITTTAPLLSIDVVMLLW